MLTNTLQYWGTLRENLPDREAWPDNLMNEKEPEVLQGPLQKDMEKDQNPALSAFEVHRSGLLGEAGHFTGA